MKSKVLITGGTGFLGKRLGKTLKVLNYDVILTGRNNKQNSLAKKFSGCEVAPMDVSSIESVRDVFCEFKPNIVVHAAATKFVDLAETYPMECIDVNVLGSQNVARVSLEYNVDNLIGISTDKAAPPIRNIYGMSKATMERIFCSLNGKSSTKCACVRYGNVAWSTGSVFTIWKKMLEEKGVIGTTGPEMRRFFFTVDEAVNLVIKCIENIDITAGKVLSRQMKAARIGDFLKVWIDLKGGRFEKISSRPGERNDEYLIGELELPYTEEILFDNIVHYLISFNQKVKNPVEMGLSSANTEKLSVDEIINIIENPPFEEIS